jgi:xanthine/uracil permease
MGQTAAPSPRHPVDEILPPGPMFVYGLQHVMSMYAGVVAVPLPPRTASQSQSAAPPPDKEMPR